MSYLPTLAISVVSDPESAECFMQISHSISLKVVVLGSMVWSALIKRNGTILVHFVRLLDNDRPSLWYRPRPSARRGRYKGHLDRQFVGSLNFPAGMCAI
jgi:hypothetical protein